MGLRTLTELRRRVRMLEDLAPAEGAADLELGLDVLNVCGRRGDELRAQLHVARAELAAREDVR